RGTFVCVPRTRKTTDGPIGAWYAGRMTVPTFAFGPLSIIEVKVNQGSVPDTGDSSIDRTPVTAAGIDSTNLPSSFIAATLLTRFLLTRFLSTNARAVYAVFGLLNASSNVP